MIVLDTCVVAEALKPGRDSALVAWLDKQSVETLYLTSTSFAELLTGVSAISDGKRKSQIRSALDMLVERLFASRILPFDHLAAQSYCSLLSAARVAGLPVSYSVLMTGAVAAVHGFIVATHDTAVYESLGVPVINPWNADPSVSTHE